jgi:hypothetical protein
MNKAEKQNINTSSCLNYHHGMTDIFRLQKCED